MSGCAILNCDPVTEIRYLTNGDSVVGQDYISAPDRALAWSATPEPPSPQVQRHLAGRYGDRIAENPGADWRRSYIANALDRYRRGIPVSNRVLERLKEESRAASAGIHARIPPNVIDSFGTIDARALKDWLPDEVRSAWPSDALGRLRVDRNTLEDLDNRYSRNLRAAQRQQRDWILFNLVVDDDGRHRHWCNALGTRTGRDNPVGASFARLSQDQRVIIQPKAGRALATIDFCQQELAIALCRANSTALLDTYRTEDLYEAIGSEIPGPKLSRAELKSLVISHLYGANAITFSSKFGISVEAAERHHAALTTLLVDVHRWSLKNIQKSYRNGFVECLDWRMAVTSRTSIGTLRNWPIQAAGADILRRACLGLADHGIEVVYCLHDSVTIEAPTALIDQQVVMSQRVMARASAEVLSGFLLRTVVEAVKSGDASGVGGSDNE